MSDTGFDMFDEEMDEDIDRTDEDIDQTQLPTGKSITDSGELESEEDEEEEEEEFEDDGLSVLERCKLVLSEYKDNGVEERHDSFYESTNLTDRGRRNVDLKGASGFVASTTGDKLIRRAGCPRSSADAKCLISKMVDMSAEATICRAVVKMATDKRRTIRDSDVKFANNLIGKRLV